jgi:predicted ATPase
MLREIEVSGFKSLDRFQLKIHRGMNVLVGPNGSGKTNIIRFFDFVAYLQQFSISEAISKAGGAGEVFRRVEDLKIERTMSFRIRGAGKHEDGFLEKKKNRYYAYEFEANVEFAEADNRLAFKSQRFRMKEYKEPPKSILFQLIKWDATFSYGPQDSHVTLTPRSGYKLEDRMLRFFERYKQLSKEDVSIQEYLLTSYLTRYFPFFEKFAHDVSLGNTYNIVPSKVRQPEDIAQTPVINSDGSGLAATLYHLRNATDISPRLFYGRRSIFGADVFAKVQAYFGLVNPNLSDVEVKNDPYENKLKVSALVRSSGKEIRMPLNLLSDGTIKWLALVTAISTTVSYFAIEEPENYIHPKMQQEFANIVRESCEDDEERFALITTHSETLLNAMRPNEIIIVNMEDGRTFAKSVLDPDLISAEISRTGFGLGYYYVTDAVNA